jgi:hypothetical protein
MAGWNPISTAPHDIGRPLLLYPRPVKEPGSPYSTVFEGYWTGESWRTSASSACYPTYWMPMPAPPLTIVNPRS